LELFLAWIGLAWLLASMGLSFLLVWFGFWLGLAFGLDWLLVWKTVYIGVSWPCVLLFVGCVYC